MVQKPVSGFHHHDPRTRAKQGSPSLRPPLVYLRQLAGKRALELDSEEIASRPLRRDRPVRRGKSRLAGNDEVNLPFVRFPSHLLSRFQFSPCVKDSASAFQFSKFRPELFEGQISAFQFVQISKFVL